MKLLLTVTLAVVLTGCASTPAPEDVRYIDTSKLDSTNTRIDEDDDQPVTTGLDNTIPDEGEYDLALWVLNVSGSSASFTLKLRDDATTREIWRGERLSESIDIDHEPDRDGWSRATRMCVVRVKGESATVIVNGEEHSLVPTGRARVDTWMIALLGDHTSVELFELH
ncbi:MAG: hypothetical protein K8I27_06430 [Planctomycetes bacterium]|nr:hypothetical protein [Planctomycetota bacterium]